MPIRPLNTVLLIAVVIGGVLTYRADRRRQPLLAEHARLEEQFLSLPIEDPSKVHVRALDTGEELHFAWRIYYPAGYKYQWRYGEGNSFTSSNSDATEFIARVRFRENKHGELQVFVKQAAGSAVPGLGGRQVADVLRDRWDEVQVEQLGSDDTVAIDADKVVRLLRLTLSDDLKREVDQKLSEELAERFQTALFDVRFGTDKALQQAAAADRSKKK